jgi:uncharacterized repeat protein (TIGR03803 family)
MKSYWANRTILYLLLACLAVPWLFSAQDAVASAEFQVLKALGQERGNPHAGLTLDGAGNLYGTTLAGGTEGYGTVFKIDPSGNVSVLFNFSANIGLPLAGVVPGDDGSLYGTTPLFNEDSTATAYKLDASGNFTVLHAFGPGFITTVGGLIKGIDGNFYGASDDCNGVEIRSGTIYKIDSAGNYSVVYEFPEFPEGCQIPNSEPIQGSDGSFYGTTNNVGAGTVFKLDPSGNFSTLHEFDSGIYEQSKLLLTSDGSLYGTTFTGGANDAGIIYKIDPSGTYSVLHEFDGGNGGKTPAAGLIQGSDGNFYGTTTAGGTDGQGIVYRISQSGDFTVLHSFDSVTGAIPYAPLVQYGDGSFYGTTDSGGSFGQGVIFKLDPAGTVSVVHSFGNTLVSSVSPYAALTEGSDGNFYGTTSRGGGDEIYGTVFRIDASGNTEMLHSFDGSDGASPFSKLVQGSDSSFYGTTFRGGANNAGTVYKIDTSGTFDIVHEFDGGSGGTNPNAGLIRDSDGNLYGTTVNGGGSNSGIIFKIDPAGVFTVLHDLNGGSDGAYPYSELVLGDDGNLYGSTVSGGGSDHGVVFKIDPSGSFTILHNFDGGSGGSGPYAALIQGSDSALYGTTVAGGGNDAGTIFSITPSGTFNVLHEFDGSTGGSDPRGELIQGNDSSFYGTTTYGGSNNTGTIFKLTTSGNFTVLHSFDGGSDGAYPLAGLIQASDGSFYGTTTGGGTYDGGVIYRLTETTQATTTTLTSSRNPSVVGQSVTFTATVTGNSPTGTVEFFVGSTGLGSRPLSNGGAALSTPRLVAGTHSITAVYSGDANNAPSTSAAVKQVVKKRRPPRP